jgi:CRISPR-associated protein Csm1
MRGVSDRELRAALAAAMVAARALARYEATAAGRDERAEKLLGELRGFGWPAPEAAARWLAGRLGVEVGAEELEELRRRALRVDPALFADQPGSAGGEPLLSPLWVLKLMGGREWDAYQELWRRSCSQAADWSDLLKLASGESLWLPALPMPRELTQLLDLLVLRTRAEAASATDYGKVCGVLAELLERAARFYSKLGSLSGFFDTLDAVLSSSLALAPAWAGARPPDVPLNVAARLAAALSALPEGFSVVTIDINGIQDFVYAPVVEAAASRVLRGRSLLVELVQFTAVRLAARMLGALAQLTKEGGAPVLIAPPVEEGEVRRLSEILSRWMSRQFAARLWITVAASQRRDAEGALCPGEPLSSALEELRLALQVEKDGKYAGAVGELRALASRRLRGFDSLTREPVLEDDPWALAVSSAPEYADSLAPGKLAAGDLLSGLTHLSLACGSAARNLAAIVSLYFFKGREPCGGDARRFADEVARDLAKRAEAERARLYARVKLEELLLDVAIAPFCEVGAVHLLAALHKQELGKPWENRAVAEALLRYALGRLKELREAPESDYVHIEVRVVNAPRDFLLPEELAEELRGFGVGVGVSMMPYYTNAYHPARLDGELRLVDLDEMGTIAVAHLDGNDMGEIAERLAKAPTLLAAFSELLSLGFGAKAYACLLKKVESGAGQPFSVILYAGGDDVAAYGRWYDVIGLLSDVGTEVLDKLLRPLTACGGISLADCKTPILHLFQVARNAERDAKRWWRARGGQAGAGGCVSIQKLTAEPIPLRGGAVDLRRLADCLAAADALRDLKMLIYSVAEIADEATGLALSGYPGGGAGEPLPRAVERASCGSYPGREEALLAKARVVIGYKYLVARREDDFEKLNKMLSAKGVKLPSIGDSSDQVVRALTELKPLLDLLALKLRE